MEYFLYLITLVFIYCLATLGHNFFFGYTGRLSVHHGALMAVAAYTFALSLQNGLSYVVALFLAATMSALVSFLFSLPLLKLKEDAFVVVSLGFSFIAYQFILNLPKLTGGALGIKGIASPFLFSSSRVSLMVLVFSTLIFFYLMLTILLRSGYGVIIKAIREHEVISEMAGHQRKSYQRSIFVLSGIMVGFAGAFLASFISTISPGLFTYSLSVLLLMMTILGGLASLHGSLIGATILILLPEALRFLGVPISILAETQHILYGLTMIVLMIIRPVGLFGRYRI